MADIVDKATRSRMMSRIRSRDTRPELLLRAALRRRGIVGYRCHWAAAPGRPDIAFPGRRIAIFVDGAFWHGHPDFFTFGKSGEAWDAKIRRNIERDREVDAALFALGWRSCRVWDFEILENPDSVAARLAAFVRSVPQPTERRASARASTEPADRA